MRKEYPLPIQTPIETRGGLITKPWADFFRIVLAKAETYYGTHAERISDSFAAIGHPIGTQFYEIDRGLLYTVLDSYALAHVNVDSPDSGAVLNVSSTDGFAVGQIVTIGAGTARQEKKEIDSISAGVSLTMTANLKYTHTAADRDSVIVWLDEKEWFYTSGTMTATLADAPTDLGVEDEGLLLDITTGTSDIEYYHTARWTGEEWAPVGRWGGYFSDYAVAPIDLGWQLCDGTATKRLSIDGDGLFEEISVTVPDLTAGVYKKAKDAYTGTVEAAVAPTATGTVDPTVVAGDVTGISIADHPAHTHTIESTVITPDIFVRDITATGYSGVTGGPSAVLSHTITDGEFTSDPHTHTMEDLEIDDTGEPAHLDVLPYFRR